MYVLDPVNPNPLMLFFGTVSFFVLAFLFSIPVLLLILTFAIMLLTRFSLAQRLLPKGSWYIVMGCGGMSFFIIAALYNDFIRESKALYNGNAWIIVGLGYLISIMLMIKGVWESRAVKWQGNSTWKYKEDHQKHYQRCVVCREHLPTKRISFEQNIGMLFVRRGKVLKGSLCRHCINRYFREYTIITLTLGWWGTISFIFTPIIVVMNTFQYIGAFLVPPTEPRLETRISDEALQRLQSHNGNTLKRLKSDHRLINIAEDLSQSANVTLDEALLYIKAFRQNNYKNPISHEKTPDHLLGL